MAQRMPDAARARFSALVLNALTAAVWMLTMQAWIVWPNRGDLRVSLTILAVLIIGARIALSLRQVGPAIVLTGFSSWQFVELAIHQRFGSHMVQGGNAHFAIMFASFLAVGLSALIEDVDDPDRSRTAGKARDLLRDAGLAGVPLDPWSRLVLHALSAVSAAIVAELAVRSVFGPHPFQDDVTDLAVVGAGAVGACLGALIRMNARRSAKPIVTVQGFR